MKKQFKKSLSLLMAILMVMSCWVWVAPTKASAAEPGKYTLSITATVTNPADTAYINVKVKKNNGTGDEVWINSNGTISDNSSEIHIGEFTSGGNDQGDKTFTLSNIDGFPSYVDFCIKTEGTHRTTVELKSIAINGVTVCSGGWTANWYQWGGTGTWHRIFVPASASGGAATTGTVTDEDGKSKTEGTWNWVFPQFANNFSATSPIAISIPKIGEAENVSAAMPAFTFVDQYGVERYQGNGGFVLTTGTTTVSDFSDEQNMYFNATDNKVHVKDQMQVTFPIAEGKTYNDYYVNALGQDGKTVIASQLIRVNYPTYNYKFISDYVTSAGDDKTVITLKDGNTVTTSINDITADSGYIKAYGQNLANYPVSASKTGFEFLGFWTVKQPAEGDLTAASPYSLNAKAMSPISSVDYANLPDDQKGLYYNAGTKWDPSNTEMLTCTGDVTYYAWFRAADINVKFYTLAGKYITETTTKYGKLGSDISWPVSGTDFPDRVESGPFTYSNWNGKWDDISGLSVNTSTRFTKDLVLTPVYDTVDFKNNYNVTFYSGNGSDIAHKGEYTYRAEPTLPTVSQTINQGAKDYTYEFVGWTTKVPTTEDKRHIIVEDGDFNVDNEAVVIADDFIVRSDATYYPVYRRHLRSYDVTFSYRNDTGSWVDITRTFKYGQSITAPDGVPSEYAQNGMGYKFKGWSTSTEGTSGIVNLREEICQGTATYTAQYYDGVPTAYNVTFISRNDKGEELEKTFQVNHGDKLTEDEVKSLTSAQKYDDGENLWTFASKWEYNGTEYSANDLISTFSPTSHVTFRAVYGNPIPFYTVTYVDEGNSKEYRIPKGDNLPQWTVDTTEEDGTVTNTVYTPTREDTKEGKYTFIGWATEKQSAEQIESGECAGIQYFANLSPVNGNLTLYPQFKFEKFSYKITFNNFDGTLLATDTFNYGDSLAALEAEAEGKATKAEDETYTYSFIGWDKEVPSFCEGGVPDSEIVFTAQYQARYIYYTVEWFNDEAAATAGTDPKGTGKYIYGDKIHTTSVELTPPTAEDPGRYYVISAWKYLDEDGNEQTYTRGLILNKNNVRIEDGYKIKMWAEYTLADRYYTVTVKDDHNNISYDIKVKENDTIANLVSEPASGYVDETHHNAFDKWVTKDGEKETEFALDTPITEDITIYAKFTQSEHELVMNEVVKAPTYPSEGFYDFTGLDPIPASDGKGLREYWCSCSREKTKTTALAKCVIPALTDAVNPTATTYIGINKWNTFEEATNDDGVFANPNTDLIITTTDKGDVNDEFNPTGKGIGVNKIDIVILQATATNFDGDFSLGAINENEWETIYYWPEIRAQLIEYYGGWAKIPAMYKEYNANVTTKVSDYDGLIDGSSYIAFYRVTDKSGNVSYMRTAEFLYDATSPVVEVTGDCNEAKDTYCSMATVTVSGETDNEFTVEDNGTPIEVNDGKAIIGEGVHRIVVTDKAGNKTTKYFTVNKDHIKRDFTQPATCLLPGYKSQQCIICGHDFEKQDIEALDHDFKDKIVEATCVEDGYIERTCSRCDFEEFQYYSVEEGKEDELLYPAKDHSWNEGVVTKKATCLAEGLKVYTCSACSDIKTETIPVDTENGHSYYKAKIVKATCTEPGERSRTCRLCGEKEIIEVLEPTEHIPGDFVLVEDSTCYELGYKRQVCDVCGAAIKDANNNDVTEVITMKPHHWVYDAESSTEPTVDAEGHIWYKCDNEGCTKTKDGGAIAKLEKRTVTFIGDNGEEVAKIEKIIGETIGAGDVPEQTKANSEDGKYEYVFDGWYTKKDGNFDKKYTLAMTVSEDLTLYAKFKEVNIYYTAEFKVPTSYSAEEGFGDYKVTKVLMGAVGDKRLPSEEPTFKGDKYNSFVFAGWETTDGGTVYDGTMVGEDKTYQATFSVEANKYNVIFMNGDIAYGKIEVEAGKAATIEGTPTKASDRNNHYTFSGWYTSSDCSEKADLTHITQKTTVYAGYTSAAHKKNDGTLKQAGTCTLPEIKTYQCEDCTFEWDEITKAAPGHKEAEKGEYKDGKYVYNCSVCGEFMREVDASFTIIFDDFGSKRLDTLNIQPGTTFVEQAKAAAERASRPANKQYEYKFIGWQLDGKGEVIKSDDLPAATADARYVAAYDEIERKYTVTFATVNGDAVISFSGITYGTTIDKDGYDVSTYEWNKIDFPAPESDANGHYVFAGWDTSFEGGVKDNTLVRPVFNQVEHNYDNGVKTDADCQHSGGYKYTCKDCGYYYVYGNVPSLGHNWVTINTIEPTFTAPGKEFRECQRCGATEERELPIKEYITVTVTVKDSNGKRFEGAKVIIAHAVSGKEYGPNLTNKDGVATFKVEESGKYFVSILEIPGHEGGNQGDLVVDESGKVTENIPDIKGESHTDCSCGCHRNGFWGSIFRFFHKIIKLFAGRYVCCDCPDSRY